MQTFTLDLIARFYDTKFVAFALPKKEPARSRPSNVKRVRQTLCLGGTSSYQCWRFYCVLKWKRKS